MGWPTSAAPAPGPGARTGTLGEDTPPTDDFDLDAVASNLDEVDRSMVRLDDGTYGRCSTCAAEIEDDLLAVSPVARSCAAHLPI